MSIEVPEGAVGTLVGIVLGLLQVLFGWQIKRINSLESKHSALDEKKADKADVDRLIETLRDIEKSASESRAQIFNTIRVAVENQSNTNVDVATALGRLQGALEHRD